eukprot:TRINITY_DN57140_c0_g1_i1.p1 TRINITY_DN57140_c0_g1~~TRINITY_DN57140_c0_g1_i1.p1  ORF type:complete len:131 (-),score=10.05 TRINITY_DN57140_c0_g1_i1:181-573(-)
MKIMIVSIVFTISFFTSVLGCSDLNANCEQWASNNECNINPDYMLESCPYSCRLCDEECLNLNGFCDDWAAKGECQTNPEYMLSRCKMACYNCGGSETDSDPATPTTTTTTKPPQPSRNTEDGIKSIEFV